MGRERSKTHPTAKAPRPSRRIHDEGGKKLREIAACPSCGASYRNGRWTWQTAPADAYPERCPACERIETSYPAGRLDARGAFAVAHREELVGLVRNVEQREKTEHPLHRVIDIDEDEDGFTVTVTHGKLAQAMGRALESAYEGALEQPGTNHDVENLVRVHWSRD